MNNNDTNPDSELPREIKILRSLIFDYTDDKTARLRELIVALRDTQDIFPKHFYTDIIEDIFKDDTERAVTAAELNAKQDIIDAINSEVVKPIEGKSWLEIRPDLFLMSLTKCLNKLRKELNELQAKENQG